VIIDKNIKTAEHTAKPNIRRLHNQMHMAARATMLIMCGFQEKSKENNYIKTAEGLLVIAAPAIYIALMISNPIL